MFNFIKNTQNKQINTQNANISTFKWGYLGTKTHRGSDYVNKIEKEVTDNGNT